MSAPVLVGPSPSSGGPVPSPDWDDVLADIGDRIRAERQARGWSRDHLGEQASMTRDQIRRLELGLVGMRNLLIVCRALGVEASYILSGQWQAPSRRPVLGPRLVEVLREASSGDSLTTVGARLGIGSQAVAAALSRAYVRLGVAGLPQDERRAAAARVAMQHGLFDTPPNRTSSTSPTGG